MQNIEKKKKIFELRLRLLNQMKDNLQAYKELGNEDFLIFAKELGKDSEKCKKLLDKLK